MKKLGPILIVVITILTAILLISCSKESELNRLPEDERAIELIKLANETIDKHRSYTMVTQLSMELLRSDSSILIEKSSEDQWIRLGQESMQHLSHASIYTSCSDNGQDIGKTETAVFGYRDGYLYTVASFDGKEQTLKSALSYSDYMEYLKKTSLASVKTPMLHEVLDTSETIRCGRSQDGTWMLSFSGFTDENIEKIKGLMGIDTSALGKLPEVTDISLSIEITTGYLPRRMSIDFMVPEEEMTEISFVATIKDFENPEINDVPDITDYKEVADVRVLFAIEKQLAQYKSAATGSFSTLYEQTVNYNTTSDTFHRTDEVTFAYQNGSYTFQTDTVADGQQHKISYVDGKQNISYTDENGDLIEQISNMSDAEAKAFIDGLIDPIGFSKANIADIRQVSEGCYVLDILSPDTESYGEVEVEVATVTVVFEEEKLLSYEYQLKFSQGSDPGFVLLVEVRTKTEF